MAEAAAIFRVSKRVFAQFIVDKPFYRTIGRAKLFTDQDIAHLYEAMESGSSNQATRQPETIAYRSEASEFARVAQLMAAKRSRRRRSD
ncbi:MULTISPECIES: hypothetical protein [unclassified Bradyrhizobium]|uniref:hypothetical protein n=1 Tax=unclassified Bradyrhizobium TaxID=2631580 RepID=UPI0029163EC7|nr:MULTISPECIES: hypothetical protein [unclassified Bradyrhizobium]